MSLVTDTEIPMGVPGRFAKEYPSRLLELFGVLEHLARERDLLGSFGLLTASAVLTIPYERMKHAHFLHRAADADLVAAFKSLEKGNSSPPTSGATINPAPGVSIASLRIR
jgi:hypothetical protein